MSSHQLKTPIVFIIFKRADTTQKVFEVIRQVRPEKLFVVADGPRSDRVGEAEKTAAARAIVDQVDWDCQVAKDYSDINLGCAKRVSSGLDWVFSQVKQAIILEDDCIPDISFFRFCEELLDRYQDDERVMSISGQNVQFGHTKVDHSYYFSRYHHCWGWATWQRAWKHFDFSMSHWPDVRSQNALQGVLCDTEATRFWGQTFQATCDGQIDSWANRWMLACWLQNGLSILSRTNLVSNVGFGMDSTNTKSRTQKVNRYSNMTTEALDFPLHHPPLMLRNIQADSYTQKTLYSQNLIKWLKKQIRLRLAKLSS